MGGWGVSVVQSSLAEQSKRQQDLYFTGKKKFFQHSILKILRKITGDSINSCEF
jgi:hypothetical protein